MEAKDTVIHGKKCAARGYMTGGSLGTTKIHYSCTCGREVQAEFSFEAGIREAVVILRKIGWSRAADDVEIFRGLVE